jgi:protein-L-isoaspartate(D-aspartate) O-methyltransferase
MFSFFSLFNFLPPGQGKTRQFWGEEQWGLWEECFGDRIEPMEAERFIRLWGVSAGVCGAVLFLCCRKPVPNFPEQESESASVQTAERPSAETGAAGDSVFWKRPRTLEREQERMQMVEQIRREYGLADERVLEAMRAVPRHWFVPVSQRAYAYLDSPLPIGHGQTISQPFIVAFMTSVLNLEPNDRVLEIGTGSGYQAAVLNEFTPHVYTIEIVRPLAERAMETFAEHGYQTIQVRIGDGYKGWPEAAPFDAIIVTCAPEAIPEPLLEQLKPGGRMIIPVGSEWGLQELVLVEKDAQGDIRRRSVMPVRFVPLKREKE